MHVNRFTGDERCMRRRSPRGAGIGVFEQHALRRKRVNIRARVANISMARQPIGAQRVDNQHDYIRLVGRGGWQASYGLSLDNPRGHLADDENNCYRQGQQRKMIATEGNDSPLETAAHWKNKRGDSESQTANRQRSYPHIKQTNQPIENGQPEDKP